MPQPTPSIMWFREDLRLKDNPALRAAVDRGAPVICVYIYDDVTLGKWSYGSASKWWLHQSIKNLSQRIDNAGGKLILRHGAWHDVLPELLKETGARHIYWNRRYGKIQIDADRDIKESLSPDYTVETFNGRLLYEPWEIKNGSGGNYRVFTPMWKAMKARADIRAPLPSVTKISAPQKAIKSERLEDLNLLPQNPDWSKGFDMWSPGEKGAADRLHDFMDDAASTYKDDRNRPDRTGTSGISPHLHFGEISPVQIWSAIKHRVDAGDISVNQADVFLSEIAWREFSYSLLYFNEGMTDLEINPKFKAFPWKQDHAKLRAWQIGETGYPIVDAGMRQLWQTGWMHNRVRMVVGSFLVKHLLVDWRDGMRWFWDTLLDADLASNTASWQWIAGCGADAAPYFRIFNPMTQGERFDPDGAYVRKYIKALKDLPTKYIHEPWKAPKDVLKKAGVRLGENYPHPIVDHKEARQAALDAYEEVKKAT